MGKTALVSQLSAQIEDEFECAIWQSLRSRRSLVDLIDREFAMLSRSISTLALDGLSLAAQQQILKDREIVNGDRWVESIAYYVSYDFGITNRIPLFLLSLSP